MNAAIDLGDRAISIDAIAPLEAERKRVRRIVVLWAVLGLPPLAYAMDYAVGAGAPDFVGALIFVAMLGVLAGPYGWCWPTLRRAFKAKAVAQIVRDIDPSLEYHAEQYVDNGTFLEAGLFRDKCVTDYKGEDLVRGTIGVTP